MHQANRKLDVNRRWAHVAARRAGALRGATRSITLLASLIDATKFGYVPLEYYDIDRAVVRMLPESLTLKPFDRAF